MCTCLYDAPRAPTHLTCIPTLTSPSATVLFRLSLSLYWRTLWLSPYSQVYTRCFVPHAPQTALVCFAYYRF